MFKIPVALILILSFVSVAYAEEDFDVRKVRWGMSEVDVRYSETGFKPAAISANTLVYTEEVFSHPCSIAYEFINNKLFSITYAFDVKDSGDALMLTHKMKTILGEKYKEDKEASAKLSEIEKKFISCYANDRTRVTLADTSMLPSKKFVGVIYKSVEFSPLAEAKEKAAKDAADAEKRKKFEEESRQF